MVSLLGMLVYFFIVNTIVWNKVHENVLGSIQANNQYYAASMDNFYWQANDIVENLASTFSIIGADNILDILMEYINFHEFIFNMYVGFSDGEQIAGATRLWG